MELEGSHCINVSVWRRKWQPTPELSPGKSHGQRSLVGYSHGVTNWMKLSDFTLTLKHHSVFSALPGTVDTRKVLINFKQNVSPQ